MPALNSRQVVGVLVDQDVPTLLGRMRLSLNSRGYVQVWVATGVVGQRGRVALLHRWLLGEPPFAPVGGEV